MCTASSALAGCLLHGSGQKVIPFSTNLLALRNYSSLRNIARSSHSTGDMMEKRLWDCASTRHAGSSIQPNVFGKLQHGTDTSASGRCFWKDCSICECTWNFRCVYLRAIPLFAAVDIAWLAGSCYYSLWGLSSVHQYFRPEKCLFFCFSIWFVYFFKHLFPKCIPFVLCWQLAQNYEGGLTDRLHPGL